MIMIGVQEISGTTRRLAEVNRKQETKDSRREEWRDEEGGNRGQGQREIMFLNKKI